MEALSDGVFSIASTLLVLEIALEPPGEALDLVLEAWPSYLGYLISFMTIGAAWLGHSAITDRLERADPILLRINLLLLFVVAFLPFPTKLIAEALHETNDERVFVTMYGLTLLSMRVLLFALDTYARDTGLYASDQDNPELQTDRREMVPVLIAYMAAILIGLAIPIVSVLFYLALGVFLVVPIQHISRALRRTRRT
jgi:uncharacterized membrane protein